MISEGPENLISTKIEFLIQYLMYHLVNGDSEEYLHSAVVRLV